MDAAERPEVTKSVEIRDVDGKRAYELRGLPGGLVKIKPLRAFPGRVYRAHLEAAVVELSELD